MDANRFIVVEGLPGAGKSVLAKALSQALHARLVEDPAGANPFWDLYQKDPLAHGFSLQVFSLLQRFRQQQGLAQGDLFGAGMVSDYLFERDRIFAHLILGEAELGLYEQLYKLLARETVPRPDQVVYLQAATEVLQRRSAAAGGPDHGARGPGGPGPGLQPLFLPLQRHAAAGGEHQRPGPAIRGPGFERFDHPSPGHPCRHAVLHPQK